MLMASQFYFCIIGPYYWILIKDARFIGYSWGAEAILSAATLLSIGTSIVAFSVMLLWIFMPYKGPPKTVGVVPYTRASQSLAYVSAAGLIGALGCLYVLWKALSLGGGVQRQDGLFLIAFQFSDLVIPVLIFLVGLKGYKPWVLGLLLLFAAYAVFTGLRYKLALIAIPLAVHFVLSRRMTITRGATVAGLFSGLLFFASVMTNYRRKFESIDLSGAKQLTTTGLLDGFFAETNIIFGLRSITSRHVDQGEFIYFQPVIDAFLELIPRVLLPGRRTGEYLNEMRYGLGSGEGFHSGTTYPFVGEYAMMAGYPGVVLGCILFATSAFLALHVIESSGQPANVRRIGWGLVAALFGYYAYSRGYSPQVLKALLFVMLPYLFFCMRMKSPARGRRRQPQRSPTPPAGSGNGYSGLRPRREWTNGSRP